MCQFFFFRADPLCIATCSVLSLLISFCGSSAGCQGNQAMRFTVYASPLRVRIIRCPCRQGENVELQSASAEPHRDFSSSGMPSAFRRYLRRRHRRHAAGACPLAITNRRKGERSLPLRSRTPS